MNNINGTSKNGKYECKPISIYFEDFIDTPISIYTKRNTINTKNTKVTTTTTITTTTTTTTQTGNISFSIFSNNIIIMIIILSITEGFYSYHHLTTWKINPRNQIEIEKKKKRQ